MEWVMLDASHIKVHQHGMGAPRGTEDAGRTKGGINTKIHVAVDSHGMPIRFLITAGNQADCTQGIPSARTQSRLYRPEATVKFKEVMTNISISYVTWWKTIFKKLKDGVALQHDM